MRASATTISYSPLRSSSPKAPLRRWKPLKWMLPRREWHARFSDGLKTRPPVPGERLAQLFSVALRCSEDGRARVSEINGVAEGACPGLWLVNASSGGTSGRRLEKAWTRDDASMVSCHGTSLRLTRRTPADTALRRGTAGASLPRFLIKRTRHVQRVLGCWCVQQERK